MRVLLVARLNSGNTYIDSLYDELKKAGLDILVSETEFWNQKSHFDIVHVHWIESLFNWNIKNITGNDINKLKFRLESFKKSNTKLVITRHNELPHYAHHIELIKDTYELFYSYTNGMIHLGNYSKLDFKQKNNGIATNIRHSIIKHGNYIHVKNEISKNSARNSLAIPKDRFVFLCFGKFRANEEKTLVMNAFKNAKVPKKTLLCTGWDGDAKDIKTKLKRKYLNLSNNYTLFNAFVAEDNIQTYMNAADALIVPRINSLNSGLVYLGLSFGKTIIGPKIGNIQEVIEDTNNLLFDPAESNSLSAAMQKAFELKKTDIYYKNMIYARDICDWEIIAKQHLQFYNNLMQ